MGPETFLDLPSGEAHGRGALVVARGPALWPAMTADDLRARSDELAAALRGYGLDRGRSLAILADAGPEVAVALLAAARAGAKAVALDPGIERPALASALRERRVAQVIAGDDEGLNAVLAVRPDLEDLELVLVARPRPSERPSPALRVDAACLAGAATLAHGGPVSDAAAVDPVLEVVGPDGRARAWTHSGLLLAAERLASALALTARDVVLTRLPATHDDFAPLLAACLVRGARLVFDAPPPARLDIGVAREVEASIVAVQASDLDELHRDIVARERARSWFGRRLSAWAVAQGRDPERHPRAHRVAEALVLGGIRSSAGTALRRIQVFGRPSRPEAVGLVRAVGFTVGDPPGPLA